MSSLLGCNLSILRKGLLRTIFVCVWLLIAVHLKEGAAAGGFRHWSAVACFVLSLMSLADLIVFVLTEINTASFNRAHDRVWKESGFNDARDRVDGDRWNAWVAARKTLLQSANRRVTILCYVFGWMNPLIFAHCHRLMIDWRWELKDWRGVKKSIWWTRSRFSKCNDGRILACHIVWDYWKRGILPSQDAYSYESLVCVVWDRQTAYLPFLLAAQILLDNSKEDEAQAILLQVNQVLKSPLLNDIITAIQKNRWKKLSIKPCLEYYLLDFGSCIAQALKERKHS